MIALLALSVLGASATAITYLITHPGTPPVVLTQAAQSAAPIFLDLEPFTVSLSNERAERLLHVGLTLKVADEASRRRLEQYLPVVRSRILILLTEQDPEAVQTAEGKRQLANAVRHAAGMPVEGFEAQQVIDVLFTAFVVQ